VNLENLTKSKPLLIFINTRGRNLPWSFAGIEDEFTIMARMPPCKDEAFCNGNTIEFTKDTDPNMYGKVNRSRDPNEKYSATDSVFEKFSRTGLQLLQIQASILDFLVKCTSAILHDMPQQTLLDHSIQEEPPLSDIIVDMSAGHATFSNIFMTAPYCGWHSLNFQRLRGYIAASFDLQKEHVWSLREDPSYFADTLREYEEHAPYKSDNSPRRKYQEEGIPRYRSFLTSLMIDEAHSMLVGWQELNCRFAEFD
jgi:hypothetical protein